MYMKKINKSLISGLLVFLVVFGFLQSVYATAESGDIAEDLKKIQEKIDKIDLESSSGNVSPEGIQTQAVPDSTETNSEEPAFSEDFITEHARGKIVKILDEKVEYIESMGNSKRVTQYIDVLITTGPHKNEHMTVENYIDDTFIYNLKVRIGQKVILYLEKDAAGTIQRGYIGEVVRDYYIYILSAIFIALLVIIGGKKGVKTLLTLGFTILCITHVFLPLTLKGYDATLLSLGICFVVTIVTILIVSGINTKSYAAILGTMGGVACAGILSLIFGKLAALTGMGDSEAQMLAMIPGKIKFNFEGLLFSGIILGALGAVMDVCMSIASSMTEIKEADPSMNHWNLFKSAMNVGKDMMGTMSNTLILAYTGSSMYTMLLFMAYNISIIDILNQDFVASEIVRALAGSIGLILAIPVTAGCFITLLKWKGKKKNDL